MDSTGKSKGDVRYLLQKEAQIIAKTQKADKFTPGQIGKLNKS
jgi:hypothetical protein